MFLKAERQKTSLALERNRGKNVERADIRKGGQGRLCTLGKS